VILLSLLAAATAPSAGSTDLPPEAAPPPRVFLKGAESRACDAGHAGGEVVVCGRGDVQDRFRLRPAEDPRFADRPVRAETSIGNAKLRAHGEQGSVGGFTSPRAMVTLSWPF
jgi:hypothetical protein